MYYQGSRASGSSLVLFPMVYNVEKSLKPGCGESLVEREPRESLWREPGDRLVGRLGRAGGAKPRSRMERCTDSAVASGHWRSRARAPRAPNPFNQSGWRSSDSNTPFVARIWTLRNSDSSKRSSYPAPSRRPAVRFDSSALRDLLRSLKTPVVDRIFSLRRDPRDI